MLCDALQELFADEFKQVKEKVTEKVTAEVTEKVTEEVTEKVTTQMIQNTYESIKDPNTIAQILKIPLETVKKSLQI